MRMNYSHVRITENAGLSIFFMTEINKVSNKKIQNAQSETSPKRGSFTFMLPPTPFQPLDIFWGEEWVPGFDRYPFPLLPGVPVPRLSVRKFAPHPSLVCSLQGYITGPRRLWEH